MTEKAKGKPIEKPQWKGFWDCHLSDEQRKAFAAWDVTTDELFGSIDYLLDRSYKITLTVGNGGNSFIASITCNAQKLKWSGYTMTSYAPSAWEALKLLVFKHFHILSEDWNTATFRPDRPEWG